MKKYLIFGLLAICLFISCNKQLQEKPDNFLSPAQFFKNDAEAIEGVNGAYYIAYYMYGGGNNLNYWSALGTDIGIPSTGDLAGAAYDYQLYTVTNDDATLESIWTALYKEVANCNLVISEVNGNPNISDTVSKQVLGQALFFRSLAYYWLTCYWGGVPMWLDALDVTKISGPLQRTPVDSIRQQMISDLKVAAQDLPGTWTSANLGRPSRWAADMLLGQVYLWRKDWGNAAAVADAIIANQGGSNRLIPNYSNIWGIANEYNPENIWEVDYTQTTHATDMGDDYTPRQVDEPNIPGYAGDLTGYGLITSMPEFLATFDPQDLREPWYDWHGAGGVTTNHHYVMKRIVWGEPRGNHGLNGLVYRMAGAYLMYAEAENELSGPTATAYARINAIRERAGLTDLSGLSQDQFRQAVRTEVLHELSFEYNRRWDLIRWGMLYNAVKSVSVSYPAGAMNIQPYDTLQPIPSQEISLNPALTQNPGY